MPIPFRPVAILLSAGLALPAQVKMPPQPCPCALACGALAASVDVDRNDPDHAGRPVQVPAPPRLGLERNGWVVRDLDLVVAFTGPHPGSGPDYPEVTWAMHFRCADSGRTVAAPVHGHLLGTPLGEARVSFEEAGRVEVLLICRTPDGWVLQDAVPIQVD